MVTPLPPGSQWHLATQPAAVKLNLQRATPPLLGAWSGREDSSLCCVCIVECIVCIAGGGVYRGGSVYSCAAYTLMILSLLRVQWRKSDVRMTSECK